MLYIIFVENFLKVCYHKDNLRKKMFVAFSKNVMKTQHIVWEKTC